MEIEIQHLQGLIAAPFTPMNKDGSLNTDLIPSYYHFLKQNKVTGAFICGSTGEGVSLTMQEKKDTTKAWADCTKDDADFKVMLLTGGTCIADCIELAKFAQQAGIYAVSFTAPFYFKPANV
jgi:N-acetylneuraminate lyase